MTVPTVGRFRAEGFAILTTQRIIFCAQRPYRTQNGEFCTMLTGDLSRLKGCAKGSARGGYAPRFNGVMRLALSARVHLVG